MTDAVIPSFLLRALQIHCAQSHESERDRRPATKRADSHSHQTNATACDRSNSNRPEIQPDRLRPGSAQSQPNRRGLSSAEWSDALSAVFPEALREKGTRA